MEHRNIPFQYEILGIRKPRNQLPNPSQSRSISGPWARLFKLPILLLISYLTYSSILSNSPISSSNLQKKDLSLPPTTDSPESPITLEEVTSTTTTSLSSIPTPLNTFQLAIPVLAPNGRMQDVFSNSTFTNPQTFVTGETVSVCEVVLMQYVFNASFGMPFLGDYTPPSCMKESNVVMMNLTVNSRGNQFDRLAIMYFGASEVFRTSTEEPTRDGIIWTYVKDMSEYMYFWRSPQKVIFDLPNQTTVNLTGVYTTTLIATFLTLPNLSSQSPPATLILPISLGNTTSPSVFKLPADNATTSLSIPRNTNRAVFSLSSTGQADEEFWWSNVFSSSAAIFAPPPINGTFPPGSLLADNSPFREVQLWLDGMLIGVQWPFPVIFTGGVILSLWNPVVGIDAFDLKEYEIDISPFLGVLCDGNPHIFEIRVVGLDDDGVTAQLSKNTTSSWLVTGKLFLWTDENPRAITTGEMPRVVDNSINIQMSQQLQKNSTGANTGLDYTLQVSRNLTMESKITTKKYGEKVVRWSQTLAHSDNGTLLLSGFQQLNTISTSGTDTIEGPVPYKYTYIYPLTANITNIVTTTDQNTTTLGTLSRSKNTTLSGTSVHPSGLLAFETLDKSRDVVKGVATSGVVSTNLTQSGSGLLFKSVGRNVSIVEGNSSQSIRMGGVSGRGIMGEGDVEFFWRTVGVVNGTIEGDEGRVLVEVVR